MFDKRVARFTENISRNYNDAMPRRCAALLLKSSVFFEGSVLFNDTLVDIQNLHFNYDGRPVLEVIDMKIPRGKVVAIDMWTFG